jgi:hypothetical protein
LRHLFAGRVFVQRHIIWQACPDAACVLSVSITVSARASSNGHCLAYRQQPSTGCWHLVCHAAAVYDCLFALQDACSFNGAWRGKPAQMARVYYVSSYFWDRASESGIIADKAAIDWKTSPGVSCVVCIWLRNMTVSRRGGGTAVHM